MPSNAAINCSRRSCRSSAPNLAKCPCVLHARQSTPTAVNMFPRGVRVIHGLLLDVFPRHIERIVEGLGTVNSTLMTTQHTSNLRVCVGDTQQRLDHKLSRASSQNSEHLPMSSPDPPGKGCWWASIPAISSERTSRSERWEPTASSQSRHRCSFPRNCAIAV